MVICPVCGNKMEAVEAFCPDCRADLSMLATSSEPEDVLIGGAPPVTPVAPPPPVPDPVPVPVPTPVADDTTTAAPVPLPPAPDPVIAPPPPPPTPTGKCVRCGCPSSGAVCNECAASPAPTLILEVEGHEPVRFRGRKVFRVAVTMDELLFGRRDAARGIYPDVDLQDFHGQPDTYLSRKQAQVVRDRGAHYVEDLAGQDTTEFAGAMGEDPKALPKEERRELKPGNRFILGSAVGFTVKLPEG